MSLWDSWEYQEFNASRALSGHMNELQVQGIYSEFSTKLSWEGRQAISSLRVAAAMELADMRSGVSFSAFESFERVSEPTYGGGGMASWGSHDAYSWNWSPRSGRPHPTGATIH